MSEWPALAFENLFLREISRELRKRADALRTLTHGIQADRVNDIEEFLGGGGVPHERLDLKFTLWGEPALQVDLTIYDNKEFFLQAKSPPQIVNGSFSPGKFNMNLEGELSRSDPRSVVGRIEETLSLLEQPLEVKSALHEIGKLWKTPVA